MCSERKHRDAPTCSVHRFERGKAEGGDTRRGKGVGGGGSDKRPSAAESMSHAHMNVRRDLSMQTAEAASEKERDEPTNKTGETVR